MLMYLMKRIHEIGLSHLPTATFGACFCLLSLRSWERFLIPHLWAEDGSVFLTAAYELGIDSLTQPLAGYYHTVPRLLAYAFSLLPVSLYPRLIVLSSVITCAAVSSQFSRFTYRWLVPSDSARVGVCLAMCVAPGLYEVLGNLANLHNLLMVYLGFVAIRNLHERLSLTELAVALLALGSEGACIVLLPAFIARLVFGWRSPSKQSDLLIIGMMVAWTATHATAAVSSTIGHPEWQAMFQAALQVVPERFVLLPLLGARKTIWLIHFSASWVLGWIILSGMILVSSRRLGWQITVPAFTAGSAFALYVVTWMVRPEAFLAFTRPSRQLFMLRYAYVAFPHALVVWSIFLSSIRFPARYRQALQWMFCGIVSLLARQPSALGPVLGGGRTDWPQVSAKLEEAVREHSCVTLQFPSTPPGWVMMYRPPASMCRHESPEMSGGRDRHD